MEVQLRVWPHSAKIHAILSRLWGSHLWCSSHRCSIWGINSVSRIDFLRLAYLNYATPTHTRVCKFTKNTVSLTSSYYTSFLIISKCFIICWMILSVDITRSCCIVMLSFLIALLERITLVLLTVDTEQFLLLFQRIMTTIKEKKAKAMTDYRITSLHCYTIPAVVK